MGLDERRWMKKKKKSGMTALCLLVLGLSVTKNFVNSDLSKKHIANMTAYFKKMTSSFILLL